MRSARTAAAVDARAAEAAAPVPPMAKRGAEPLVCHVPCKRVLREPPPPRAAERRPRAEAAAAGPAAAKRKLEEAEAPPGKRHGLRGGGPRNEQGGDAAAATATGRRRRRGAAAAAAQDGRPAEGGGGRGKEAAGDEVTARRPLAAVRAPGASLPCPLPPVPLRWGRPGRCAPPSATPPLHGEPPRLGLQRPQPQPRLPAAAP